MTGIRISGVVEMTRRRLATMGGMVDFGSAQDYRRDY